LNYLVSLEVRRWVILFWGKLSISFVIILWNE